MKKQKTKKYIVAIMCLVINSFLFAQEEIDLFILAGQSNAQGWQAKGSSYPVDSNNLDSEIRLNSTFIGDSNTGGWITMEAQPGRFTNGHFGPEVLFSRNLKLQGYNPAIFKYCKGSSSLATEWKQSGTGGFYDDMVVALNIAIKELEDLGHIVNVKGFIWIQGEADAQNATYTAAYQASLTRLINDLRSNVIVNSALPIILGVDDARDRNLPIAGFQQNIAAGDDNIIFTSMVGLQKADATHLTAAGVIQQGGVIFNDYKDAFINDFDDICLINQDTRTGTATLNNESWGQSFTPSCDGVLVDITFDSQTVVPGGVNIVITDGADCTGTILSTKTLTALAVGANTVAVGDVAVVSGTTYFFKVTTIVDDETFQIDFSNLNPYDGGNLITHIAGTDTVPADKTACDRAFANFDWKFSIGISTALSVLDVSIDQPEIYPNPVKDIFTITKSEGAEVLIYNSIGKVMLNEKIKNNKGSVNISNLDTGIYYIRINNNGVISNKKIVKN